MNLIAYSDSEGSDDETPQLPKPVAKPAPKPTFHKVVDRSNPGKIKLNLPTPAHKTSEKDEIETEAPPAKRARTGGGAFGGFNAMLPAPKRPNATAAAGSSSGSLLSTNRGPGKALGVGVNLKTGAEPTFQRQPKEEEYDEEGNPVRRTQNKPMGKDDFRAMLNLPPPKTESAPETKPASPSVDTPPVAESKPVAKPKFMPLSMARKKKPLHARASAAPANGSKPVSTSTSTTPVSEPKPPAKPAPKPKVSLFSATEDVSAPTVEATSSSEYQPLLYNEQPVENEQHQSYEQSHAYPTLTPAGADTAPDGPQDLTNIASELNLTEAQRRQLFGRKGQDAGISAANIIEFNTDKEYAHNERLRQLGETVQHNALKSISGTGKNSLRSLINVATTQKDALEEHFAAGRRNKKEAGNKYGW
ncbi:hypothetical protein M011DRAFT_117056 [Sporormia fimetaria CBS 119925]|uniref:Mitotic checkpoint regulator, MAD2B-interacting-domain-containing protein n=1 Tax=Sporormia fimetaria CBS 119925 TaxID=1340428 RepID=A0A6A6VPI1_9PLEO|nr:hypothetical protein M011DRAFT_117056 [Sporormia fimetaria CBS 119925]